MSPCAACSRKKRVVFENRARLAQHDPLNTGMDAQFTDLIGRYRVRELLEQGSSVARFRAEHEELGQPLFLEVLDQDMSRQPASAARFLEPARRVPELGSPRLPEARDLGRLKDGRFYAVWEWIEGRSLAYLLASEPPGFSPWRVSHLVTGIMEAAHAAAERGLSVGVLTPDRIHLVFAEDDPDFVRLSLGRQDPLAEELAWAYSAPECVLDSTAPCDERAAVYSVAVIAHELLTGRRPFRAHSREALVIAQLTETTHLGNASATSLSLAIERVLSRALARDPARRYDSLRGFADALAEATAEEPCTAPHAADPVVLELAADAPAAPRAVAHRRGLMFSLGALGSSLVGITVVLALMRHPSPVAAPPAAAHAAAPAAAPAPTKLGAVAPETTPLPPVAQTEAPRPESRGHARKRSASRPSLVLAYPE